jgi:hypothetical protein|tara:strand:- start:78 stop:368 length:291 start_codon:yes stop_codon:yes gene_type:complete
MNKYVQTVVTSIYNPGQFTTAQLKSNKNEAYLDAIAASSNIANDEPAAFLTVAAYDLAYGEYEKDVSKEVVDQLLSDYLTLSGESINTYTENLCQI